MKDPKSSISDLIKNEKFIQWVVNPNFETDHFWSRWLSANPTRKDDVERARQVIQATGYKKKYQMKEGDYNLVLSNVIEYNNRKQDSAFKRRSIIYRAGSVAAAVLALLVVTVIITKQNEPWQTTDQSLSQSITKVTKSGQKLRLTLPDGTTVVLNSESTLTYSTPFSPHDREVSLVGEAFFDVVKNPDKPFIVHSASVTTRVLGTSFNVRSYPNEPESTVSVVTGKVQVSDGAGQEASLSPHTQGVFNLSKRQLLVTPFEVQGVVGWKDGLILFEKTSLGEVFSRLERWYGVHIKVQDKEVLEGEYTGRYENASLEKVLKGIGFASGFTYRIEEKEVIINKKITK